MTNILIADDHPIFRKGLYEILLSLLDDINIYEFGDGEEVISFIEREPSLVDFYILDIDMPCKNGIELCRYIKNKNANSKVIILTVHNEEDIFFESLNAKTDGYVLKENSAKELNECIKEILKGNIYVSYELRDKQANYGTYLRKKNHFNSRLSDLSKAELKTLELVAKGYTSKEIASVMFVTPKSVDNYRSRICKKLNIEAGSNALINWVVENKDMLNLI